MTGTQAKRPSRKTGGRTAVFPTETVLPLEAEEYAVTQEGEIWRVTASQMAAASAASFLPRLHERR